MLSLFGQCFILFCSLFFVVVIYKQSVEEGDYSV